MVIGSTHHQSIMTSQIVRSFCDSPTYLLFLCFYLPVSQAILCSCQAPASSSMRFALSTPTNWRLAAAFLHCAGTTFFRHFFCAHYAPVAKISSVVISIDLAMLSRCLVAFVLASLCAALAFAHEPGDVAESVSASTLNYSSMSVRVSAFIHLNRYHSPIS